MIRSVNILNFQAHRDTQLEFSPGVNVIVGPSDSGKSAIIRALRWLVWNRPSGDSFRSHWGGPTEVRIETTDGKTIYRRKDKVEEYGVDKQVFHAFKTEVPIEVQQALQITDVNLQQQLDSPFLLSQSSGEVATYFNRIAGLDVIDTIMGNLQKWNRANTSKSVFLREEMKTIKAEVDRYDYLERMEAEVEVLEGLEQKSAQTWSNYQTLGKIIRQLEELHEESIRIARITTLEPIWLEIQQYQETLDKIIGQLDTVNGLVFDITEIKEDLYWANRLLELSQDTDQVIELTETRKNIWANWTKLQAAYIATKDNQAWLEVEQGRVKAYQKQWAEVFPDECPLCNSVIKRK